MKILTVLFLISLSYTAYAQDGMFVRVYDLAGKKFDKGLVFAVTDTSLQLVGKDEPVTIHVNKIGLIKTKRSAGNNVLVGSIIGASLMAILGAISANSDNSWYGTSEGAAAGALVGLPAGAAIGGLTLLFKNSKTYLIKGDVMKWKAFQSMVTERNH